ncbi:unnamed protein product, partial [Ceratitis capitata]
MQNGQCDQQANRAQATPSKLYTHIEYCILSILIDVVDDALRLVAFAYAFQVRAATFS